MKKKHFVKIVAHLYICMYVFIYFAAKNILKLQWKIEFNRKQFVKRKNLK